MSQDKVDEENRLVEVKEDEAKLETLPVEVAGPKDQVTGMSLSGSRDPEETMMADWCGEDRHSVSDDDQRVVLIHGARRQGGDLQASGAGVERRWRCWFYSSERSWTRWTM